jgi:hypothetical protein
VITAADRSTFRAFIPFAQGCAAPFPWLRFLAFLAAVPAALQAQSVSIEAESGTLGASYATGNDAGTVYISNTSNNATTSPGTTNRVATYSVTFPDAGTYRLYARVRVGAGEFDDDSFFHGNAFGTRSPTT